MKPHFLLFSILLGSLLWSCQPDTPKISTPQTHYIDVTQSEPIGDSLFFEEVRIIALQTSDEVLIKEIHQIKMDAQQIFVLDQKGNQLLVFNTQGQYLTRIGSQGNGPEEWGDIVDFEVTDDEIIIYSNQSKAFYYYNKDTYTFRRRIPLDNYINGFHATSDGYLHFANYRTQSEAEGENFNIHWADTLHQLQSKQFPFSPDNGLTSASGMVSPLPDHATFLYNPVFSDTLYHVNKEGHFPRFIVKIPNHVPIEHRTSKIFFSLPFEQGSHYGFISPSFAQTEEHLFFYYHQNKYGYVPAFYHISSRQLYAGKEWRDQHPLLQMILREFGGTYDDYFVFSSQPTIIDYFRRQHPDLLNQDFPFITPEDLRKIQEAGIEDNPLIVLIKIKK